MKKRRGWWCCQESLMTWHVSTQWGEFYKFRTESDDELKNCEI